MLTQFRTRPPDIPGGSAQFRKSVLHWDFAKNWMVYIDDGLTRLVMRVYKHILWTKDLADWNTVFLQGGFKIFKVLTCYLLGDYVVEFGLMLSTRPMRGISGIRCQLRLPYRLS